MSPRPLFALFAACALGSLALTAPGAVDKAPMPADFPEIDRNETQYFLTTNGTGEESRVRKYYSLNYQLLRKLDGYTSDSIAA